MYVVSLLGQLGVNWKLSDPVREIQVLENRDIFGYRQLLRQNAREISLVL